MAQESLHDTTRNIDPFAVHLMSFNTFAFHGLESSRTDMKCQFLSLNTSTINGFQHARSKMQACCRSRHATLYFGINRLISL